MILKIDGVQVKNPHALAVSSYNLTKSGRVASGKMTMDLIAKKKRLDVTYNTITGRELQQILDLIDGDKMFFSVEYEDHTGTNTITCYVGSIPRDYFRRHMGWYYKNVKFALIEQ